MKTKHKQKTKKKITRKELNLRRFKEFSRLKAEATAEAKMKVMIAQAAKAQDNAQNVLS